MNEIKINDSDSLVFIQVPERSILYDVVYEIERTFLSISDGNGTLEYDGYKEIEKGYTYIILGEVIREGVISFDCEKYVSFFGIKDKTSYLDYLRDQFGRFTCKNKEESFLTRMEANGIYLNNPIPNEPNPKDYPDQVRINQMLLEDPNRVDIHPTKWGHDMVKYTWYKQNSLEEGNKYIVLLKKKSNERL